MSRLTKRHGKYAVQIGAETRRHDEAWLKLAHYEDLEEQGRLIELPCKVGDTVWRIQYTYEEPYVEGTAYLDIFDDEFEIQFLDWIGEWVFLTKEEAEAKLAELEGE